MDTMSDQPEKDEIQACRDNLKRHPKMAAWLKHYLNMDDIKTYMNATASARAAGYDCISPNSFEVVGATNLRKFKPLISDWLDKNAVSPDIVLGLLGKSMRATRSIVFNTDSGIDEREIIDHQARVPALRLAAKVLGMEAPTKHELAGLDGKGLEVTIKPDMTPQEAERAYSQMLKGDE